MKTNENPINKTISSAAGAKKDVPKSDLHKENIAKTQKLRHALREEVAAKEPELTKQEQWDRVRFMIANNNFEDTGDFNV
jgi:hypothetical protein